MSNLTKLFNNNIITKRYMVAAIALFAMMLAPFAYVGSASAAATCNGGRVCLYQNSGFGGSLYQVGVAGPSGCLSAGSASGIASSLYNNTFLTARYYSSTNCDDNGCWIQDGPMGYRTNLALDYFSNFCSGLGKGAPNDNIRSFRVF